MNRTKDQVVKEAILHTKTIEQALKALMYEVEIGTSNLREQRKVYERVVKHGRKHLERGDNHAFDLNMVIVKAIREQIERDVEIQTVRTEALKELRIIWETLEKL